MAWLGREVSGPVYQSGSITYSQWISLITLASAPFVVHIVSGAPEPTYLCRSRPKWHDRMCLYCPLTILWRYTAITDRRIRARNWSPIDLAAANAIFWTPAGWDGSEEIADLSQKYCNRHPKNTRMTLLSWDSVKTVVTTLQAIQTLYNGAGIVGDLGKFLVITSFPSIFAPVAVLGLWRLYAAFWITNDFSYFVNSISSPSTTSLTCKRRVSMDSFQVIEAVTGEATRLTGGTDGRFQRTSAVSIIFRVIFILSFPILCIGSVVVTFFPLPDRISARLSATSLAGLFMLAYTGLLAISIYTYQSAFHGFRSTVIPCINSVWYKVVCGSYFAGWLILFTLSAVETRRTPCGTYTTAMVSSGLDARSCPGLVYVASSGTAEYFGLLGKADEGNDSLSITDFVGSCQGLAGKARYFSTVATPVELVLVSEGAWGESDEKGQRRRG